jgi:hypothetical protein
MVKETMRRQKTEICWTPRLIRRLRGKRTQTAFGTLLGTSKNNESGLPQVGLRA